MSKEGKEGKEEFPRGSGSGSGIGVTPVVDMNSMMDAIQKVTKDKSGVDALLELFKEQNLEFITEYPNVNYTKLIVKLMTWRASIIEVANLDDGYRFEKVNSVLQRVYHPELDESDVIIKEMVHQFMLKMTSHRRRRSQELVSALQQMIGQPIYNMENKAKRSFFGMR